MFLFLRNFVSKDVVWFVIFEFSIRWIYSDYFEAMRKYPVSVIVQVSCNYSNYSVEILYYDSGSMSVVVLNTIQTKLIGNPQILTNVLRSFKSTHLAKTRGVIWNAQKHSSTFVSFVDLNSALNALLRRWSLRWLRHTKIHIGIYS